MKKIRVGIVGLGNQALRHLSALTTFDEIEISAVCDINQNSLKRVLDMFRVTSHYTDYQEMAEKSDVDCVFITTKPDETHSKVTNVFLENNKHVFCEKPMATKMSDAESMVENARKNGKILMIGYNRRYMPVFQRAKQEFEKPNQIDVCIAEMCGEKTILRGLNANYVHIIDVLRWFCGEPLKVQASAKYVDPDYEETIVASIEFDSGARGVYVSNSKGGGYVEHVTIYGSSKTAQIDTPSATFRNLKGGAYQPATITSFITDSWRDLSYRFGFLQEDRHFIECIKAGEKPLTSGEDSLKTLQLVNSIYAQCKLKLI